MSSQNQKKNQHNCQTLYNEIMRINLLQIK